MVKQKDAVFNAVVAVKGTSNFTSAVELTKDERQKVLASLLDGFKKGDIEYAGDTSDATKLNAYVSGLLSNWLRKDKRLNGNTTYAPAKSGPRADKGNDAVKAMRTLLSVTEDETAKAEIQQEIDRCLSEGKSKKSDVKLEALPDSLKHLAQ